MNSNAFQVWSFRIAMLLFLTPVYWVVNAHGLRLQLYILGEPIWKLPVPGLSYLRHYHASAELDIAHMLALLIMMFVFYFASCMVRTLLMNKPGDTGTMDSLSAADWATIVLGTMLILGDAAIFFVGISHHADSLFGGDPRNFVPAVATAMYLAMIGAVALIDARLDSAATFEPSLPQENPNHETSTSQFD